jgi:hypothetical protein
MNAMPKVVFSRTLTSVEWSNTTLLAEDPVVAIRRMKGESGPDMAYRALMLEAYERHPDAFTSSVAERAVLPLSWWEARLARATPTTGLVLGAMNDGRLAGVAGLSFETHEKARHKATNTAASSCSASSRTRSPSARRTSPRCTCGATSTGSGVGRDEVLRPRRRGRAGPGRATDLTDRPGGFRLRDRLLRSG